MIDGPLLIAVATTKAAQVIRAEQWPPLVEGEYDAGEVAQAVIAATETGKVDVAVAGVSLLLGEAGRAAHLEDVVEIRKEGQIPMPLFLIADTKTYLASTTGVPRPVLN